MLDSAVTWFGLTIENALTERVKVTTGTGIEYRPKYSLARLLRPETKLPRPPDAKVESENVWSPLLAWAGKRNSGIRRWKYVPPEENTSEVSDG